MRLRRNGCNVLAAELRRYTAKPIFRMRLVFCLSAAALAACKPSSTPSGADSVAARTDTTVTVGKTKLQAFQSKTGSVVILGFSRVATLPGLYGATADIEARELTDAGSGTRTSGLGVSVKESGSLERNETSYVDYEELDGLLRGIDYIAKIERNPTKLADFQADFTTKGDLRVATFSSNDGKTLVAVKSGTIGGATVYYQMAQLAAFRGAIARAKALLDSIKPSPSK
jgi:hypothetical protein